MIYIGIPSRTGAFHWTTVMGLLNVERHCGSVGMGTGIDVVAHDAFIGRARNVIAKRFLESPATDLVFIDDDVGFKLDDFKLIMRPDVDICMGLYRMKDDQVKFPALMYDPIERHPDHPELIKLQYGPTGFMRIKRNVFERMQEEWPTEWYEDKNGKVQDFFPHGRIGNFFVGEDIKFCERAIRCGFNIWATQGTRLKHTGSKTYESYWQLDIPEQEAA